MEYTEPTSSSHAALAIVMTFLALVICLPFIGFVILVWMPLKLNATATKFTGKYFGWNLVHVTGRVLNSQRHTQTTTTTTFQTFSGHSTPMASTSSKTDVYDSLTLQLADNRQVGVEVVNFNVSAFPGQVASFWTAVKGRRAFTFAVLNHTTNQENVNDQQVFKIMLSPALQMVFVFYLIGLVFPIAFMSVFGGKGVPLLLFFTLLILFAIGQKRVRGKFGGKGMSTIWQQSRAEASALMAQ
jgi:hypothetical protein